MIAWFRHWRNSRRRICVATAEYITTWQSDGKPTGDKSVHFLEFWIDGNSERWTHTITSSDEGAKQHYTLMRHKLAWIHRGELPSGAQWWRAEGQAGQYHRREVMTEPKRHWNYRLVRRMKGPHTFLAVVEVHYEDDKIAGWSPLGELDDLSDDLREAKLVLEQIRQSAYRPILNEEDLPE